MLWNMIGSTTVPGWLPSADQRIFKYAQLSCIYACGKISGRSSLVVNIPSGDRVGVSVGVVVAVGVMLGLGVTVLVAVGVLLGTAVEVCVEMGALVRLRLSVDACGLSQADRITADSNKNNPKKTCLLLCDRKKGVMIADLPMIDAEDVAAIADRTL